MARPAAFLAFATSLVLLSAGCITLGPEPTSPEHVLQVHVDSIPSGADLYAVSPEDGMIGARIGRTPCDVEIGLALRRYVGTGTPVYNDLWHWSPGGCLEVEAVPRPDGVWSDFHLWLHCAAATRGYHTEKVRAKIGEVIPYRPLPEGAAMTIPLRPGAGNGTGPPGQQQQQQQQTVIIGTTTPAQGAAFGTVFVTCPVEGAEIAVDGLFVGNAPATLRLKEGIHVIEVTKPGHHPYKRDIRVLGGAELTLRAQL